MVNNNLTEIIAVLDRSGSMSQLIDDVIGGYNSLIEKQRAEPGECRVTTLIFDNEIEILHEGLDIREVPTLTRERFFARGSTALNDALMRVVNKRGAAFASIPENSRPGRVVVFVSTDGYENASTEFPRRGNASVKEKIREQSERYNWQFIFTGADMLAQEEADEVYGIDAGNALNFAKSAVGTKALYRGVSDKITQYRSGEVVACNFTDEEREEVEKHAKNLSKSSTPTNVTTSTKS